MTTKWRGLFKQGIVAGLIGFAAVAVVFALVNLGAGRSPWYSAAVLGGALFYDVADPTLVSVTPSAVVAYSALHLGVFIAFGLLAAELATLADRGWQLWFVALFFSFSSAFTCLPQCRGSRRPCGPFCRVR